MKPDFLNFRNILRNVEPVFLSNCSYKKVYFDMIAAPHNNPLFQIVIWLNCFIFYGFFIADLVQVFWELNY